MTTLNYYNTILPFIQDLDENIVSNKTVQTTKDSTCTIDFINPVTGSTDRVIFEGSACTNNIHGLYYVIGYSDNRINEELIMENLEDLYDFILIEDEIDPVI